MMATVTGASFVGLFFIKLQDMKTKKKSAKTLLKRQRNDRDSMTIDKNKKHDDFETAHNFIERHFSMDDQTVKKSKGADEEG
jgi:hypothetical protein